jgi:pimeloyl-ACP methyl ester carboxylesterase
MFTPVPAGLIGMSMGGAVSMQAAARPDQPWQALIILSSFDRLESVIQKNVSDRIGSFLGNVWADMAGWVYQWKTGIAISDIRSDLAAAKIMIPTLVAHGTSDRVIPHESGKRLYAALPETIKKQWIDVPEADHDNVLITDFPIYATVAKWMLHHVTSTP